MVRSLSRVCTEIVDCLYSTDVNEQQRHQATPDPGPGYVRIGELAKRTGVSPELLRAWEQRYGLLQPTRTSGGFRLYSAADEARVQRMQSLVSGGLAAAQAARLILSDGEPAPRTDSASATILDEEAANLAASLDRLDEQAANTALDRLFSAYTVETVLQDVVLPYLHRLGERWEAGEVSVAQEHFASNLLRGRLLGLAQGWGQGQGPGAILACVPGEHHELGLLVFGVALRRRGWRITYLGTNSPIGAVADIARSLAARGRGPPEHQPRQLPGPRARDREARQTGPGHDRGYGRHPRGRPADPDARTGSGPSERRPDHRP